MWFAIIGIRLIFLFIIRSIFYAILFFLKLLTNNQRYFVQKSCLANAYICVLGWTITCALGEIQVLIYNQIDFTTRNVQLIIWMLIDGCFTHRRICHTPSHMLVWYSEKRAHKIHIWISYKYHPNKGNLFCTLAIRSRR